MAQKLCNMDLNSVDLCKRGANPRADIKLTKSAEGGEKKKVKKSAIQRIADEVFKVIGKAIPETNEIEKSAFDAIQGECFDMTYALHESLCSIVQDPEQSPVEKSAAMNESLEQFNEDILKMIDNWSEGNAIIEKSAITDARREAIQKSIDHLTEILKTDPSSKFDNAFAVVDIRDNLWRANDTLNQLFNTVMADETITDKKAALNSAVDSYAKFIKAKINTIDIEKALKPDVEPPEGADDKDGDGDEGDGCGNSEGMPAMGKKKKAATPKKGDKFTVKKGGNDDMPNIEIDATKMTPEDLTILKSMQEKYGTVVPEPTPNPTPAPSANDSVIKSLQETIAKMQEKSEMDAMTAIAKKYEAIGQKPEDLAKTLYALKKSDEAGYNGLIATLDQTMKLQEGSEIFKEIGSNGNGGAMATDLQGKVAEIQKAFPDMTYSQAVVKAYRENPDLDEFSGKLK